MTQPLDFVAQFSSSIGTGSFVLADALAGHRSFAQALGGDADVFYGIFDPTANTREVGLGRFIFATNTLQRTLVRSSTGGGARVSFAAGQKIVYATLPANASLVATAFRPGDVALTARAAGGQTNSIFQVITASGAVAAQFGSDGAILMDKAGEQLRLNMRNEPGNVSFTTETLSTRFAPGAATPPQGIRARLGGDGAGNGVFQISDRDGNGFGLYPFGQEIHTNGTLIFRNALTGEAMFRVEPAGVVVSNVGDMTANRLVMGAGSASRPAHISGDVLGTGFYRIGPGVWGWSSEESPAGRFDAGGTSAATALTFMTRERADARYASISSGRWKDDIATLTPEQVDASRNLRPRRFTWGGALPENDPRRGQADIGFVAEEVAEVLPEAVIWEDDLVVDAVYAEDGTLLDPERRIPQDGVPRGLKPLPLIAALWARVEALEARLAELEA